MVPRNGTTRADNDEVRNVGNTEAGGALDITHGRRPSPPQHFRDGARRVFTDRVGLARTKREMP